MYNELNTDAQTLAYDAFHYNDDHMSERREAFKLQYNNYRQVYDDNESERYTNSCFDPLTFETVNTLRAFICARPPNLKIVAKKPEHHDKAQRLQLWTNYQWYIQDMTLLRKSITFYCFLYGTAVTYHGYKKCTEDRQLKIFKPDGTVEWTKPQPYIDYDDPYTTAIDPVYDFLPDDSGLTIDDCANVVYRYYVSTDELKRLSSGEDPWFTNKVSVSELGDICRAVYYDNKKQYFDRFNDSHDIEGLVKQKIIEILEYWQDDRLIILGNRTFVLRDSDNPYSKTWKRKPFILWRDEDNPHELWGIGEGDILLKGQHELNTLKRMRIDALKRHLRSPYFVPIGAGIDPMEIYSEERLTIEVPNPQGIQVMALPDLSKAGFPHEGDIRAQYENASGVSPQFKGMVGGTEGDTATQSRIQQSNLMMRAFYKMGNFDAAYKRWVSLNVALAQLYYPQRRDFRVIGEEGVTDSFLDYEDLKGGVDVEVMSASARPVMLDEKTMMAQTLLATYQQNPFIDQQKLTEMSLQLQEVPNYKSLIKTPEMMAAEAAAAQAQQEKMQQDAFNQEIAKMTAKGLAEGQFGGLEEAPLGQTGETTGITGT